MTENTAQTVFPPIADQAGPGCDRRAVDGTSEALKRVKAWILDEYRKGAQAAA